MLPAIFGLSGTELTPMERELFSAAEPAGYILFGRNISSREQVRALTDSLKDLSGRENVPILIDQEGGRVARLTPPEWRSWPEADRFARLHSVDPHTARRACQANYEALGLDLAELGITVNCAPVLDVPEPGAHDVIGDRAFGTDPVVIADLGRAALQGLSAAGIVGVVKHIPGHGRSRSDSHHELPVVNLGDEALQRDLAPFIALNDAPMAMTAHILYTEWDPYHCATLSNRVIQSVIRERIGFDGLLMSDDLDMKALKGAVPELAHAAIEAGCDVVLNCWGKIDDMRGIAQHLPEATVACRRRLTAAMTHSQPLGESVNIVERQAALVAERDELLALLAREAAQ